MKREALGSRSCNGTREAAHFVKADPPNWVGIFAVCERCSSLVSQEGKLVSLEDGLDEWTIERIRAT